MSKSNDVYDHVMGRLLSADFDFGERLLVKELGVQTGASRQPIMSALNRLSTEGFVKVVPQVGCEVIHPSHSEIADFFLLFAQLEGLLIRLAASRRTEEQLLELNIIQQRILSVIRMETPSPASYASLNRVFHNSMHQMAHSPLLMRKQRNNFNMCDFFITHSVGFTSFMSEAAEEHQEIIEAIADGDADRAETLAIAHIREIGNAVVAGLETQTPPSA